MSELDSQKPEEGRGGGAGSGTVSAAVPQDSAVGPRLTVFTTPTQKERQRQVGLPSGRLAFVTALPHAPPPTFTGPYGLLHLASTHPRPNAFVRSTLL